MTQALYENGYAPPDYQWADVEYPVLDFRSPFDRLLETGTLDSIWGDILGQGVAAGVNLIPTFLQGGAVSAGGQARGTAAITAFGQQAISTLQQILQALQSGQISRADAVANAQRIVNALSDPQYVLQARHGSDAAALANAKIQAAELLRQIQSLAGASSPVQTTPAGVPIAGVPITGGSAASPAGSIPSGGQTAIDPTWLLLGGGVLLILLMK